MMSPSAPAGHVTARAYDSMLTVFFPKDLSSSVTPDYLPYTLWHLANSVTGTVAGTLSMQALLQALGLGAGTAIGLAATTNWIIKDGFGLLGGVLFAGFMGNRFDASPKYYRFLANLCIQASNLMELLTPMVPHLFLPMASLSNIGKNIGFLAASATRASMHRGFTRTDNLGDITAKAGAQATAAGLVGTGIGIVLSWAIGTDPHTLLAAFVPLSLLNLFAAYKSNRAVVTRHMNIERAELTLRAVLDNPVSQRITPPASVATPSPAEKLVAPTPFDISRRETMFGWRKHPFRVALRLEEPVDAPRCPLATMSVEGMIAFSAGFGDLAAQRYRICVASDAETVWLWFLDTADHEDVTRGFIHACAVRHALETGRASAHAGWLRNSPADAYLVSSARVDNILAALVAAGWDIAHTHLGDRNRRLHVGPVPVQ
ncbi:hypothetical protein HK105_200650 [Polyrhizophydium stewartii]|uniref:Protein root UVB sensitive/RUS domain-containing protein n=1 Tax=Polyrhizophydium stewartii TaxID=2732419 RepID=A0ABR4NJN6_9FUNG